MASSSSREPLLFFPSSPLHARTTASDLKRCLPPSFSVEFFTAEKSPLTPATATQTSQVTGRRLFATKKSKNVKESFHGDLNNTKELSSLKVLLDGILENQSIIMAENQEIRKQLNAVQEEVDLYGGSRKKFATSLMAVLVVILDNEVRMAVMNAKNEEEDCLVSKLIGTQQNKPFKSAEDVTYTRCYWWYLQHQVLQAGMTFEDLWGARLQYKSEKQKQVPDPWLWKDIDQTSAMAQALVHVMQIAEYSVVAVINQAIDDESKHLTVDDIRNSCGLYITILLQLRNTDAHLLTKAFGVTFEQQPHRHRRNRGSQEYRFEPLKLHIREDYEVRCSAVLEDIIQHTEQLGSLSCIKNVILGMALFLKAIIHNKAAYPHPDREASWFWSFKDNSYTYIHTDGTLWEVSVDGDVP